MSSDEKDDNESSEHGKLGQSSFTFISSTTQICIAFLVISVTSFGGFDEFQSPVVRMKALTLDKKGLRDCESTGCNTCLQVVYLQIPWKSLNMLSSCSFAETAKT